MTTPFVSWWNMWADATGTAMKFWETMAASAVVVDRRLPMIDAGLRNPSTADHAELTGMVTEKTQAFAQAGQSLAADMMKMQGLWLRVMQDAMRTTCRPPSTGRMAASAGRAMHLAERSVAAGGRALKPVHAKATANAKRLGQR